MALKGISGKKKPLSVLCKDIPTISAYTSDLSDQKWVYKLLKNTLPGPFTYILPASKEFPKLILKSDGHVKRWKRKEVGVKMPSDAICAYIMDALDEPLICGSVPEDAEDELGKKLLFGTETETAHTLRGITPHNSLKADMAPHNVNALMYSCMQ